MHIRGGAFGYICVHEEEVDIEVEAEWALLKGPCCLSMQALLHSSIEAAVFNIGAQLSPYLFRYS